MLPRAGEGDRRGPVEGGGMGTSAWFRAKSLSVDRTGLLGKEKAEVAGVAMSLLGTWGWRLGPVLQEEAESHCLLWLC